MMHRRMPRDFAERTNGASTYDVRFLWSHKRRLSEGGSIIVTALGVQEPGITDLGITESGITESGITGGNRKRV